MTRGVPEPKQRHSGDDASADQQDRQSQFGAAENKSAVVAQKNEIHDRQWKEQRRLEEQAGDGRGGGSLAQESVKAKGRAQGHGDPRKTSVSECEIQNAEGGEQHRDKLQTGETFPQENGAEENVHQRRHEITEAGFNDAAGVYRPNKQQPVARERQTTSQAIKHRAARSRISHHFRPTALPGEKAKQERSRPNEPMRENFWRRNGAELLPVNRNQSPGAERGDSGYERGSLMRFVRAFRHLLLFHAWRVRANRRRRCACWIEYRVSSRVAKTAREPTKNG